MNTSELRRRIAGINVWQRRDERAPHKPLLLLYALARLSRDSSNAIPYREIDRELRRLLGEFGPRRSASRPQYPFLRLRNDGVWQVQWTSGDGTPPAGNVDLSSSALIERNATGGFTDEVHHLLVSRPRLIGRLIGDILARHFPASIHADILEAIGAQPQIEIVTRRIRDPRFRRSVLEVYQYRCAVCGFDLRVNEVPVAIEAAYIKWKQVNGPDKEQNGIALCVMHHRLFDRGAFTIDTDLRLNVANAVSGTTGVVEWLHRFQGEKIQTPSRVEYHPAEEFIGWHHTEVFRGPLP